MLEKVVQLHLDFYKTLNNNLDVKKMLEREKINILDGFIKNNKLVKSYYQTLYSLSANRVVLCGINPGKNGAGKTGIPFIDFKGVSQLMPNLYEDDWEKSAQFILSIINEFGKQTFFNRVYLTNISWFGFIKEGNNLNYYDLPSPLSVIFTDCFISEMNIVRPTVIVPLSKEVEKTLKAMVKEGRLSYPIASRLPHPYYCSIGKRAIRYKRIYIDKITSILEGGY